MLSIELVQFCGESCVHSDSKLKSDIPRLPHAICRHRLRSRAARMTGSGVPFRSHWLQMNSSSQCGRRALRFIETAWRLLTAAPPAGQSCVP